MKIIEKLFKDSFTLIRYNMILIQPLLIFFLVTGLLIKVVGETYTFESSIVATLGVGLLWTVFNAGWYNMIFECVKIPFDVDLPKADQAVTSLKLFKEFFPGVAMFFVPMLLGSIIYLVIISAIIAIAYYYGINYIGIPKDLVWDEVLKAGQSNSTMMAYISKLPETTINQIALWELLIMFVMFINFILNFIIMFWGQCVVAYQMKPVNAYKQSIKMVIKHPILTLTINISYSLALISSFFLSVIPFELFKFIGLFLYIFVMVYFTLMIFVYIEKQNNSIIRPDSNG